MAKLDPVSIAVADWRAARDWYVCNLGLRVEFEVHVGGPAGLGVAALQDDAGLTLFVEQTAGAAAPCGCVHTFQVEDVGAVHHRLVARGVATSSPGKHYWGYGIERVDFDGHILRLWDEASMREQR